MLFVFTRNWMSEFTKLKQCLTGIWCHAFSRLATPKGKTQDGFHAADWLDIHTPSYSADRLVGLVVKVSTSRAEDPGLESRLCQDFSRASHTSDLEIVTPVATLPGTWHYRVSAGNGQPSVSFIFSFSLFLFLKLFDFCCVFFRCWTVFRAAESSHSSSTLPFLGSWKRSEGMRYLMSGLENTALKGVDRVRGWCANIERHTYG